MAGRISRYIAFLRARGERLLVAKNARARRAMRGFPGNEIECFDCNTGPSADSCAKRERVSRDFTTDRTTPPFAELGGNSTHDEEGGSCSPGIRFSLCL